MENLTYSTDDKVDYYLQRIAAAPTLRLDPRELYEVQVLDEETYLIDQVMIEKGLVKVERETRVITSKGLEISNFGGWTVYQKLLNREKSQYIPKEDIVINKYEGEIQILKEKITELQNDNELRKNKEAAAFRIVHNLNTQIKNDKIMYLIGGAAIGFILAAVVWSVFIR